MSNNQKGISSLIGIIIVIVVGIAVIGGVLAYQSWWAPEEIKPPEVAKSPAAVPKDETVNWNVYRNEEYGYEVKYPSGARKREYREEGYRGNVHFYYDCYNNTDATYITFKVNIYNSDGLSLEEWLGRTDCVSLSRSEKISFGGIQGLKLPGNYAVSHCPTYSAYVIKDYKVYSLEASLGEMPTEPLELIYECTGDTFKKMLSTFRFIE